MTQPLLLLIFYYMYVQCTYGSKYMKLIYILHYFFFFIKYEMTETRADKLLLTIYYMCGWKYRKPILPDLTKFSSIPK